MKNFILPALALLVGVPAMAPTAQAAGGSMTEQELQENTKLCQSIREAARKCATIPLVTSIHLEGSSKTSTRVLSPKHTEDIRRIFSAGVQPFQGERPSRIIHSETKVLYFLDGNGKVLGSVCNEEIDCAGSEPKGPLVQFTLPKKDFMLYLSIIGR